MPTSTKLDGADELQTRFKGLREDVQKKTARRMVVAAGRVVVKAAKDGARSLGLYRTGALVKNIVQKRESGLGAGVEQNNVGVRHGRDLTKKAKSKAKLSVGGNGRIVKKYVDDPFYWRWLELTTKKRQGTPFIGPALEQNKEQAIEAMGAVLDADLEKYK